MSGEPWCGRTPRAWQVEALDATLAAIRRGVKAPLVHACTGAGKSIYLAEVAGRCKGPVLVTTPTQALVTQLAGTLSERCPGEVGRCYQHAWEPQRRIVVTCTASLDRLLGERDEWACWLADETHRVESDALRELAPRIRRRCAVGLTATPFRADKRGLSTWDDIVYSYPSGRAVADGVLVPWRAVRWDGQGDPDTDAIVERWVMEAEGPGIVSATSIADAEAYATRLGRGVALPIHQRCSPAEREMRIRQLQSGRIRCLVHVQLLCEGVDLPWLRWLAMRRPVSSPVRLVQEVGRVLRAAPGKTEAVLYDPHDLLGAIGLVHAAALEDVQSAAAGAEQEPWSIPEIEGLGDVSQLPEAVAVDALSGWVTDVLGALRSHGLAPPPDGWDGRPWRAKRATEKQVNALSRMSWAARYLPEERHRTAVRWLVERPGLRAGTASDLMTIMRALADGAKPARDARRHWRCPVAIPGVAVPEAA